MMNFYVTDKKMWKGKRVVFVSRSLRVTVVGGAVDWNVNILTTLMAASCGVEECEYFVLVQATSESKANET
jgi:hypothetical protein